MMMNPNDQFAWLDDPALGMIAFGTVAFVCLVLLVAIISGFEALWNWLSPEE